MIVMMLPRISRSLRLMKAGAYPARTCLSHTLMYMNPHTYALSNRGMLTQKLIDSDDVPLFLTLFI